ncbi:hypothetical protein, partial [Paraprevotella clara]|uniref:hypothetical protein n=1 Tax=Paraprevotella clara TaxID=454154 RepID=UPI0026701934
MMKNELAYRNRKGTTLWSPLSVAVCKDEKYRFLAILWGKVCVFNCIFNKLYLAVPNICVNNVNFRNCLVIQHKSIIQ